MADPLYYEDFEIGQTLETENVTIDKEHALAFAREYDPQAMHVDERAAQETPHGTLIVSGWQTAAITMKLKTTSKLVEISGGLLGLGIDKLRWPRPVYPGDTLHAVITITDKRLSQSKPTHGVMKYTIETFNQKNELAMSMEAAVWVPRKSSR